jgi:hypothetical protein
VKINGVAKVETTTRSKNHGGKQESTPEKARINDQNDDRRRKNAAEKNGYKTVMDRNNLSLMERRRVIPY